MSTHILAAGGLPASDIVKSGGNGFSGAANGGAKPLVCLEDCALLSGLEPIVLAKIKVLTTVRDFPAGATIFCEDDPAVDLFILASGRVELSCTLPNHPELTLPITRISPGEVFAWSALADSSSLTARAQALEKSRAHTVPAAALREVLARHPASGYELMCRLSQLIASRLRDTRWQLRWLLSCT
jgi:CRP-like cAMP-binding protein